MSITAAPELLAPHLLQAKLQRALPGFASVNWQASIVSTNQALMGHARQPPSHTSLEWPRLLGAHHQTAGRGRAGRAWKDQGGRALMFSCGFKTTLTLPQLGGLAPALGIASAQIVREHLWMAGVPTELVNKVKVKWPNDLMLADAKLSGILVESVIRKEQQERHEAPKSCLYLVAGMGLNLSGHEQLSTELGRAVADLSQFGVALDEVALTAALANAWQATLQTLARQGFAPFVERLKPMDYLQGKMVNVMQQEVVLKAGRAQGLTDQGALVLCMDNGATEAVMVGDVSVRWRSPEAALYDTPDNAPNTDGGPA